MSGTARTAGIVAAGGRSSRMGTSKAALDWFGTPLLARVAALVGRGVDGPVVVVRAPGQLLPPLPARVEVVDDPVEGRGPLQAVAIGLAAVADRADTAFVTATDLPLLHPAYVRRVLQLLDSADDEGRADVVVPQVHGHPQPLAAAYRTSLAPLVTRLVGGGVRRPPDLFAQVRVVRPDEATLLTGTLARVDPALDSLLNVNTPDELAAVLARPAPRITVAEGPPVHARTLGEATALLAARHGPAARVVLAGAVDVTDPTTPLVPGDVLAVRVTAGPAGVVAGHSASRRT
ncbi:molybdopterin-guanine dinucleotide biosynthesis protein MobA [Pseudonocardia sp. N23]|nr:molybdopterin-guanine dinucleotide biosynthesis protein MobA [Pseudonocardia sp. N23]